MNTYAHLLIRFGFPRITQIERIITGYGKTLLGRRCEQKAMPQRDRLCGRLLAAGSRVLLFEAPDRDNIRLGGLVQGPIAGFERIFHNRAVMRAARGVTPLYFGY